MMLLLVSALLVLQSSLASPAHESKPIHSQDLQIESSTLAKDKNGTLRSPTKNEELRKKKQKAKTRLQGLNTHLEESRKVPHASPDPL